MFGGAMGGALAGAAAEILVDIKADAEEYEAALDKTEGKTKGWATKLKKYGKVGAVALGTATAAAVTYSIKSAAAFQSSYEGFSKMVDNYGGDADKFLDILEDATDGAMKQTDLMKQANDAMMLGIDLETIQEMAETSKQIAKATGQDINYLMESLVTGMGRQSTEMLDNLGIIVKAGEAQQAYADKLGKSVSALTDAEKAEAFRVATLEAMRKKQDDLNGVQETFNYKMQKLSKTFDDVALAIGEEFLPMAEAALDWINRFGDSGGFQLIANGAKILIGVLSVLADSFKTVYAGSRALYEVTRGDFKNADKWFDSFQDGIEDTGQSFYDLGEAQVATIGGVGDVMDKMGDYNGTVDEVKGKHDELDTNIGGTKDELGEMSGEDGFGGVQTAIGDTNTAIDGHIGKQGDVQTALGNTVGSLEAVAEAYGTQADKIKHLTEEALEKAGKYADIGKDFDFTPGQVGSRTEEELENLRRMQERWYEQYGTYDQDEAAELAWMEDVKGWNIDNLVEANKRKNKKRDFEEEEKEKQKESSKKELEEIAKRIESGESVGGLIGGGVYSGLIPDDFDKAEKEAVAKKIKEEDEAKLKDVLVGMPWDRASAFTDLVSDTISDFREEQEKIKKEVEEERKTSGGSSGGSSGGTGTATIRKPTPRPKTDIGDGSGSHGSDVSPAARSGNSNSVTNNVSIGTVNEASDKKTVVKSVSDGIRRGLSSIGF